MPAVNPLIDIYTSDAAPVVQQATLPGTITTGWRPAVNPFSGGTGTTTNAAGTNENVAAHIALIIAVAIAGVFILRQSGFKFVVAGGIGG